MSSENTNSDVKCRASAIKSTESGNTHIGPAILCDKLCERCIDIMCESIN